MNVLFLSQRVPYPPDRGDRITTHHFLSHLLARGATVRVGALAEEAADEAAIEHLRGRVAEICAPRIHRRLRKVTSLRALASGEPMTLPFFRSGRLRRTVARWLTECPPDLIYVYSSSMAQYVLGVPGAAAPGRVRWMQFAELDSDKWRQYAHAGGYLARRIYGREAVRLLEFERRVAREFEVSAVVSTVEKKLFMECIPDVEPVVMPNGVDVDHFTSAGDDRREPHTIVFTGVMDYEPNVDGVCWFAERCWPQIRTRFGDARFLIVGNRPNATVRALADTPGIEVTGRVPETPPYFDRATVAIAPLRLARGVQNKVLEAMSMGLPVVSTPQAAQGLRTEAELAASGGTSGAGTAGDGGIGLIVESDAEATAAAVCALLAEPQRARAMGAAAARFVREEFRWDRVFARFDQALAAHGLPGGAD